MRKHETTCSDHSTSPNARHAFGRTLSRPVAGLLFLGLLVAVLFRKVFGSQGILYGWDTVGELYYWYSWAFSSLEHGKLPVWNPYFLSGYPFYASSSSTVFYPLNIFFLLMPTARAINASFLLHFLLCSFFFFLFLRKLRVDAFSALFGAATLASSEFLVTRVYTGELYHLYTITWFPLSLFLVEEAMQRESVRPYIALAVVVAIEIVAGHTQYFCYCTLGLGLYLIGRLWGRASGLLPGPYSRRRHLLSFVLSISLGIGAASVQWLPTLELMEHSGRAAGLSYDTATALSFPPSHVIKLFVPGFFGDEVRHEYWGESVFALCPLYVGVLPALMAVRAAARRRDRRARPLVILGLVGLFAAMGRYLPFYKWCFAHVPFLALFRIPARSSFLTTFALCALAALECGTVLQRHEPETGRRPASSWWKVLAACALLAAGVAVVSFALETAVLPVWRAAVAIHFQLFPRFWGTLDFADKAFFVDSFRVARTSIALLAFWLFLSAVAYRCMLSHPPEKRPFIYGLVLLVTLADLHGFSSRFLWVTQERSLHWPHDLVAFFRSDPSLYRIQSEVPARQTPLNKTMLRSYRMEGRNNELDINRAMLYGLSHAGGEIGLIPARYLRFTGNSGQPGVYNIGSRTALNLLNVKYLLLPSGAQVEGQGFERSYEDSQYAVFENTQCVPRVRIVHRAVWCSDGEDALAGIGREDYDPYREVFLEASPGVSPSAPLPTTVSGAPPPQDSAAVRHYSPDRIVVEAELSRPGYLVLGDPYYPGWQVRVDGLRQPLLRADYIFRAVSLAEGRHVVEFLFVPASLRTGAVASICCLLALGVCALLAAVRRAADHRSARG